MPQALTERDRFFLILRNVLLVCVLIDEHIPKNNASIWYRHSEKRV